MNLSRLQKYILLQSLGSKTTEVSRQIFRNFYRSEKSSSTLSVQQKNITQSLERLIDKELLIGFGRRTPHKWFITQVKLTTIGRRQAKKLLGEQPELPFSKK